MPSSGVISIRGAAQNNLRNIDLDLPLNQLIVVTGVSGSGKSSLAFDTLYAEGQRRYAETFSPYTRQFLERMDKPRVEKIEGIPPAVALGQINSVRTSRSTVGTMTEIADYLKLLFPAVAELRDPATGRLVKPWKAAEIGNELLSRHAGKTIYISFAVSFPAKTSWKDAGSFLGSQSFARILWKDEPHRLDGSEPAGWGKRKASDDVLVLADRVTLEKGDKTSRARLQEALENALRFGKGRLAIHFTDGAKPLAFSSSWVSPETGQTFTPPSPALFSFNHPQGACPKCKGFGRTIAIDYDLAIPDRTLSLEDGAVKPFQTEANAECQRDLMKGCKREGVPTGIPFHKLTAAQQDFVLFGKKGREGSAEEAWKAGQWYGVKGFFEWLESRTYKMHVRVLLARYRAYNTCDTCDGTRFQPETLLWKVQGKSLAEINGTPVGELAPFFEALKTPDESIDRIRRQVTSRLRYLDDIGLGYLTLNRTTRTLSGGELQRVNLTTCLGTSLTGTLFVLDEPSIGLHPRDTERLIGVLRGLRDAGNSILVVEHDESVMRAADWILELGPGRGLDGGQLVYNGPASGLTKEKNSLTADYLSGRKTIPLPGKRRPWKDTPILAFRGASKHNLKNVDFDLPLGRLIGITGVSGSGKSTLVHEIVHKHLLMRLQRPASEPGKLKSLKGAEKIEDVLIVDQSALSQTPRSTPLLYLGVYDSVRELFASTDEAKRSGLNASSFSFNSGTGRCPRCNGSGFEQIQMQFLSDVFIQCPSCEGKRFQKHVLEVAYHGKTVSEILDFTIDEALRFFNPEAANLADREQTQRRKITSALSWLSRVGLGYLRLGQPLNQLSGGESQRLKLVSTLSQSTKDGDYGKVIILDEPTTGLHFDDIRMLLDVLQSLVDHGHTVLVIEHNLEVIKCVDYLIDLGPEAGSAGGEVVAQGTPEEVIKVKASHTGRLLAALLKPNSRSKAQAKADKKHSPLSKSPNVISIHGARHHNLKNISLDIPRDKMVVVTGLSGSGKSTLAFDLLFAEGQRRYLDCLNSYARQFIEQLEKPEVDSITGIPPSVAIEQRTTRGGGKSTVATVTELYHFLRLLYAKLGVQHDPETGEAAIQQEPGDIIQRIRDALENPKIQNPKSKTEDHLTLLAPLIRGRKGIYTELALWAEKQGFPYLRVDGKWIEPAKFRALDRYKEHHIDAVLGNISAKSPDLSALVNRALLLGKGTLYTLDNHQKETIYSTHLFCPGSGRSFDELDPRLFSFNSPHGWCPECQGYGSTAKVTIDPSLEGMEAEEALARAREEVGAEEQTTCASCGGSRLNSTARAVRFHGTPITEINRLSVREFRRFFTSLKWDKRSAAIARDIKPEIEQRLHFLEHVGLDYLSLDRSAPTLSGGESQRIRLAAQLGSNLQGVLYVLDEPTIGLHPRDNLELIRILHSLRDRGNSLVVVEHDEDTMRQADEIIDLGPGAGIHGGNIIARGDWKTLSRSKESVTGKLIGAPILHPMKGTRRPVDKDVSWLHVTGGHANNLKNVDIRIPCGRLTVFTGVSGSGKSSLMHGVIQPAVHDFLSKKRPSSTTYRKVEGADHFGRIVEVDQSPIGKTSRSTVATYLGIMDPLRKLFASMPLARARGFTAAHFSYNAGAGRCPSCQGQGQIKIEMNFLPSAHVPCETCQGRRWIAPVLDVTYRDKNIHEVLNQGIDEAVEFFDAVNTIRTPLELLRSTGLGYLKLGQTSPTLSGGEAQRLRLVSELAGPAVSSMKEKLSARRITKPALYLLEEPTVGLHLADVARLLEVLHRLVDAGHTVVVIEHHPDVMAEADHLVDIGPEGGENGGTIVASGTPEEVSLSKASRTAPFIHEALKNRRK